EYGGAGLSPMQQAILNEELARARAPQVVNAMAIWWVGPAIMRYGTEAQKKRFIPKILNAEEIWATGYSEPSSGSDMAAAQTQARSRRRPLRRHRAEGVDHVCAHLGLVLRAGAHVHRRPEVGRPVAAAHGHEEPRHRHQADPADRRRFRVQRGLHERRPRAGR